jgi:dolichol-phosphate mannosyltransferase
MVALESPRAVCRLRGVHGLSDPSISVVIPTRHEAKTVGQFIARVLSALAEERAEVVVVDDSDDDTPSVLAELAQELDGSLVVRHRSRGSVPDRSLGTAVAEGIDIARAPHVCVMDADGQHPPEVVHAMLATARKTNADYVGASRYVPGGSAEGLNGTGRKLISLIFAWLTRLLFVFTPVRTLTDPLSGFFLFRREIVAATPLNPIGWKISLEILIRSRCERVTEVPYRFAPRLDGSSKATVRQGLLVLRHMASLLASLAGVRRIVAFAVVGMSGMCVNLGVLLTLAWLGQNALSWPIWLATELSILWNYNLNRRVTWRDRRFATWWLYNVAAILSAIVAIGATEFLVSDLLVPLWLGSVAGIASATVLNYLCFDNLVFSTASWVERRTRLKVLVQV